MTFVFLNDIISLVKLYIYTRLMIKNKYTRLYLLLLTTILMVWWTYAWQNATILTYIAKLQVTDSNLPNVANQKWYIWAILWEIFNSSGKIKSDYLDISLSWMTVTWTTYTAGTGLVLNGAVFSANIASSTTTWVLTPSNWTTFNSKQNALGYTAENTANKSISTTLWTSDSLYPSQNAVKTYVDNKFSSVPSSPVTSVSWRTGAVLLTKTDVWLWNVDNTSDLNKPVSTAMQTALNGKVWWTWTANYLTKFISWTTPTIWNSKIYDNGSNIWIWTSTPTEKLEVAGNIKATSYLYTSDRRLKENILTITWALDKVNKLNWVSYERKKDHSQDIWFIAQEVEKIEPKLVVTWSDWWKAVKYANITSLLVNAVKELSEKFDDLFNKYLDQEQKIKSQQEEINSLKSDIKDIKDNMYLMKMYCK